MKIEDLKKELEKQKLNEILIKDKLKIVTQESENFKREIRSLVDQIVLNFVHKIMIEY